MKPLSREHNARARERLAEQGIEMTPDELVATRKAAYATIRAEMRKRGHEMPDSDEELFRVIQENYKPPTKKTKYLVFINGQLHFVDSQVLTYEEIADRAGLLERKPSVTFRRADNPTEGMLAYGECVAVKDGATFSVADTSNA